MPYVPKPKTHKKRRVPVQARSIERVNIILDTASALMSDQQYDKITTHLIAEKAGVSVGSVYQFFPNVESVKIALIERLLDQYYERFDQTISNNPDIKDLGDFCRLLVDATHHFYQEHPDVVAHIVSSSHSEEFAQVNGRLNQRITERVVRHFSNKDFGFSEATLRRKLPIVVGIGDLMTMAIWSADSAADREAYLKDWKSLTAHYSQADANT